MAIQRARRTKARLRLALAGHSKSGKSRTALIIMKGLIGKLDELGELQGNGRICVIDTEHDSILKYAMADDDDDREDAYDFDHLSLKPPYAPEAYIKAILEAAKEKYTALIIDQISHEWSGSGGILESVSEAQNSNTDNRNQFAAWGPGTKRHEAFIETYLAYPYHVICTMRSRVKYRYNKETKEVTKLGTKHIQREEIIYEFDAMGQMDSAHTLRMEGSRCPLLDNGRFPKPTEELGHGIAEWLVIGRTATEVLQSPLEDYKVRELNKLFKRVGMDEDDVLTNLTERGYSRVEDLPERIADEMIQNMSKYLDDLARKQAREERRSATKKPAPSSPGVSDSSAQPTKTVSSPAPEVLTPTEMGGTIDELMSTSSGDESEASEAAPTDPKPVKTATTAKPKRKAASK